jgi:hypothetical protein
MTWEVPQNSHPGLQIYVTTRTETHRIRSTTLLTFLFKYCTIR